MLIEKNVGEAGAIGDAASRGRLTADEIRNKLEQLEITEEEAERLAIEYIVEDYEKFVTWAQKRQDSFADAPKAVPPTVQQVPASAPSAVAKAGLFGGAPGQQQTSNPPKASSPASGSSQDDPWTIEMQERFDKLALGNL
jgi:hypothetical protein